MEQHASALRALHGYHVVQPGLLHRRAWPGMGVNKDCPNLGNRIDVYDKQGKRLARLGDIRAAKPPGNLSRPMAWR